MISSPAFRTKSSSLSRTGVSNCSKPNKRETASNSSKSHWRSRYSSGPKSRVPGHGIGTCQLSWHDLWAASVHIELQCQVLLCLYMDGSIPRTGCTSTRPLLSCALLTPTFLSCVPACWSTFSKRSFSGVKSWSNACMPRTQYVLATAILALLDGYHLFFCCWNGCACYCTQVPKALPVRKCTPTS